MVWIWYPASLGSSTPAAEYLPQAWAQARYSGLAQILTQQPRAVRTNAVSGAPIAPGTERLPVLVMQPGLGPIASDYTTLAEDLASHGYVIVASSPTFSSGLVVFPDGRRAEQTAAGSVPDSAGLDEAHARLSRLIEIWAADVSFLLDRAAALDVGSGDHRFTGRLQLEMAGVFGHSFGGATATQVLAHDPRFKAGVDLDGWPYGDVVTRDSLSRSSTFGARRTPRPIAGGVEPSGRRSRCWLGTRPDSS